MKQIAYCLLIVSFCAGCSFKIFADVEARKFYVLNDLKEGTIISEDNNRPTIIIRDATSSRYLNSQKIVFSETPSTRGYYQFANWFEAPTKRFSTLLRKRLSDSGYFVSYLDKNRGEVSGSQLNTEIVDLYHDISSSPGEVIAIINAELIDLDTFRVIARRTFEKKVSVSEFDSEGAVDAMNKAITEILDDIVVWMDEVAKK